MPYRTEYYAEWIQHDGKDVVVEGVTYRLRVRTRGQWHAADHDLIDVSATMLDQTQAAYRRVKRLLGDEWDIDVLSSERIGVWLAAAEAVA